ncbi:TBP-associated factor 5 [Perilla frutescens var. hirtella]|nr:TBP-associated factor 5 [Perilla frutescens var. hirtella]
MDCDFPDARNQAGCYCHFSQIQLSLSAADLIRRHVLCNCKSGPMAVLFIKASNGLLQELGRTEVVFNSLSPKWIRKFTVTYQFETVQNLVFHVYDVDTQFHGLDVKALKLEEQQFLGEASCTLSEIATKVDRTSTLNLALEEVSSPAHTRYSGQLTIYAEESDAETGEKLFILMPAGQNYQDEIQLLVDKYSENNQHTCLDLNPTVAIDITGDRNRNVTYLVEKVTSKLQPRQQLLPLTNTDSKSHSIVQNLQKLELGKLVFTVALTSILGLLFSQKFEQNKASSPLIVGFMVLTAVIWNGISFGEIYPCLGNILQLIGITLVLCLICLLVGTFLSAGFSFACWLSALLDDSLEERLKMMGLLISILKKQMVKREKVNWKKLRKDLLMLALHVKKLKKDKVVGATTKAHRPESVAAASGAPNVKLELALPVIPVEVEQFILEDLRNRVQLSSMALPFISFYTFINTHDSLNCASISQDGSMIAGGFSDSSLKVWDMTKLGQQSVTFPLLGENELASSEPSSSAGGRCYTLFRGHARPVHSATFSPFGNFILSSSSDSTIRLWSTKLNANLVCYKGHNYPVWDVQFSPMGHYFASASHDRTARIWSMDRIQPLKIMAVCAMACKLHYIATGSSDKTVRLWDVQSGECVRIFIGRRSMILSLAMSPDGRYMASGDEDGTIMMWDLASGRCVSPLVGHGSCIWSLAFSCEGLLLASGSADCTVKIWDVATSSKVPKGDENTSGSTSRLRSLKTLPTKSSPV